MPSERVVRRRMGSWWITGAMKGTVARLPVVNADPKYHTTKKKKPASAKKPKSKVDIAMEKWEKSTGKKKCEIHFGEKVEEDFIKGERAIKGMSACYELLAKS